MNACIGIKAAEIQIRPVASFRISSVVLNERVAKHLAVRDRDIQAQVIDYSTDYPQRTGNVLGSVNYEQLRSGCVDFMGKKIVTSSLSSYYKALEICEILKAETTERPRTL